MVKQINPLQVVIERLGYADPAKGAFFFGDEVKNWPSGSLDMLVTSVLLQQAQPMTSIECDGCEERCYKPVVVYPFHEDKPGRAFIVCDEPNDMGRIKVSFERMKQWQTTGEMISAVLAKLLEIGHQSTQTAGGGQWPIGTLKGKKHNSPVTLLAGKNLMLSLAGHATLLMDALTMKKNILTLDKAALIRLVDNPADDSETETPEARRERIRARVREEKAKGTRAFLKVVAKEEGLSLSRIKQLVKEDAPLINDDLNNSPWGGLDNNTKQTNSKKNCTKY